MTPDLKKRKGKGSRKKMLEGPIQDTVATLGDIEDAMKFISNYIFVCKNPERIRKYRMFIIHLERERIALINKINQKQKDEDLIDSLLSKYSG